MKKYNNLFPFENIMATYFIGKAQQTQDTFASQEAELVFNQDIDMALPPDRVNNMISSLTEKLTKDTLGSVVTTSLYQQAIDEVELQERTGLTPSMIDAIKKDLVFTNSIPVRSLVKLLKILAIRADKALAAIETTFDRLQTESKVFLSVPMNVQPSFRKGMVRGELGKDFPPLKTDESYLYQNKEALNKYTSRLIELYETL